MSDYEKLKEIYDEIDILIEKNVDSSTPEFKAWHNKAERFLSKKFGNGIEYSSFKNISFSLYMATNRTLHSEFVKACRDGLIVAKGAFGEYLEEMQEDNSDKSKGNIMSKKDFSKVFIVHGHEKALREETARIIEHQGIEAIILNEQTSGSHTVIEQLEKYVNVPAAVCLFTADDLGKEKNEKEERERARQNVVFETGLVMGKLGRDNVIVYVDKDIELPSDLQGVIRKSNENWGKVLLRELNDIGYKVDLNNLP